MFRLRLQRYYFFFDMCKDFSKKNTFFCKKFVYVGILLYFCGENGK